MSFCGYNPKKCGETNLVLQRNQNLVCGLFDQLEFIIIKKRIVNNTTETKQNIYVNDCDILRIQSKDFPNK